MTNLCYVSDACLFSFIRRWLVAAVWLFSIGFATSVLFDSFALSKFAAINCALSLLRCLHMLFI